MILDLAEILDRAHYQMKVEDGLVRNHTITRAYQRYGLVLRTADLKKIRQRIEAGDAIKARSHRKGEPEYYIRCDGKLCRIVYDEGKSVVITFLPLQVDRSTTAIHKRLRKAGRKCRRRKPRR